MQLIEKEKRETIGNEMNRMISAVTGGKVYASVKMISVIKDQNFMKIIFLNTV